MKIEYRVESGLSIEEFRNILISSGLDERRPADHPERLEKMIRNANLVITARHNKELVGIARSLTDFTFCTYLSDLAVHKLYQRTGIGKELIRRTKLESGEAKLILLSAPSATEYYPAIGMKNHPFCYYMDTLEELR